MYGDDNDDDDDDDDGDGDSDDDDEPLKRTIHQKNWWKIYFFTAIFSTHQNITTV